MVDLMGVLWERYENEEESGMKLKDNIMKREAGNESKDNNNEKNIYKSYAYNWKHKKP